MPIIRDALKQGYIHLGYPVPYSVPASHSIIYTDPYDNTSNPTGRPVTDANALSYPPFFAGIRLLSESVGRLPLVMYRKEGAAPNVKRVRADDKQLFWMLHDEPNPAMGAMTFRSALAGQRLLRGNCFAERVYDDLGRDAELWPFRADQMQVLLDSSTGQMFYRYRFQSGEEIDLRANRVFHVPGFGYDGRSGYSLVSLFRTSLSLGISAQEFGAAFFRSGARPSAIITHPRGMSDPALEKFIGDFRGKNAGLSNAQRIALIEEGFAYQQVGMNLDDAQFIDTRKLQRGETATLLGVPPHMIGDVERSTSWGTGIEEQTLGFVTFSLGAHLEFWESETNRQLVRPAYGRAYYAEFLVEELLKARPEDRARFMQTLWSMGVINADWIAARENLPKPEDGSGATYYRPVNYEPAVVPGEETDTEPEVGDEEAMERRAALVALRMKRGLQPPTAAEIAAEVVREMRTRTGTEG